MKFFKILLVLFIVQYSYAQKAPLSINDLGKSHSVENAKISNDGKYVIYTYRQEEKRGVVIKSKEGTYEKWIGNATTHDALITENSQFVIIKAKDSLYIVRISKNEVQAIAGISAYKVPEEGSDEWLAYQLKDKEKTLVVRNLITGNQSQYPFISEFEFSSNGNELLMKKEIDKNNCSLQQLILNSNKLTTIWHGARADNFCMDNVSGRLAFIGVDSNNGFQNAVWYFSQEMDSAEELVNNRTKDIQSELYICNDQVRFNKNATKLFFYLEPAILPKPKPRYVSVDVWGYQDAKLQMQQLNESRSKEKTIYVFNLKTKKLTNLGSSNNEIISPEQTRGEYLLMQKRNAGDANESQWNYDSFLSLYLLNTDNGSEKLIRENMQSQSCFPSFSPDENFVVYFDSKARSFFSFEVATGIVRNLTGEISWPFNSFGGGRDVKEAYSIPFSKGVWLEDGKRILFYDQYDIWQVDPSGRQKPINITNGFGRRNKIVFRLLDEKNNLKNSTRVMVTAFNETDKQTGFYSIRIGKTENPHIIEMGTTITFSPNIQTDQLRPIKAKYANVYLVSRKSFDSQLNYYVTSDFKSYKAISNVPSQSDSFNWAKPELIEWQTFDGSQSQGILYKPSNFDSTKKYPIIFHYYESKSEKLNDFLSADLSYGDINIPYFVSNGYLVFTPDIHFAIGKTGESIYNSVESAANYLAKFPFIDSTRMGIQGFSFGGYETYYLVTHSNRFAAAVAADGPNDLISFYGSMCRYGYVTNWSENGQGRLGATPWEDISTYINNSPVFFADKVKTPLLMMHNKNDYYGIYQQGLEFFTAMRRLGKKAWMLQYDNGSHGLDFKQDMTDFTIRMTQFFDHYLKDSACPRWMLYGIPAKDKGIDDGLQLVYEKDKNGKWATPKEGGLLTGEEKKKVEDLKHRKPVTVTIE
jgi:dipeptidyl aminopeptidase/acylaminoacyl peptidase